MTSSTASDLVRTPLAPFGEVITAATPGADVRAIPVTDLADWTRRARLLVLRGFALFSKEELAEYCEQWGKILEFDFGAVLDLKKHDKPKNYIFDSGEVPYHWDGPFTGTVPSFMFFQCLQGSDEGCGGETTFCDTTRVLADAPRERVSAWENVNVTYRTEKLAHYGGQFTASVLGTHPVTGERTIRFAEPVSEALLNPIYLDVEGTDDGDGFISDLSARLHDPAYKYAHVWREGDIVISDNHANVHGRNAFVGDAGLGRHLQRVEII